MNKNQGVCQSDYQTNKKKSILANKIRCAAGINRDFHVTKTGGGG